tara:strand:- start:126 stop:398 length:273 start_codon:yes stop_codon:yes gene_type:complete
MKFEFKTENENFSKLFSQFFRMVFFLTLIIILCDVALKLGIISRNHKIDYNCRLLSVEKSKSQFKKLSRLSNLKSKQQIWEFCREVLNKG